MKKSFFSVCFLLFFIITLAVSRAGAYTLEDATELYNLGIDYYSQNQVQKSMEYFKKAIALDPKFYEAYYNLAQIQASYGYTDAAIRSYEKVVQLKPDDYESVYELSRLLYKRGYLTKAMTMLERVPANDDVYSQVLVLKSKIKQRQEELALIQKQKEEAQKAQLAASSLEDVQNALAQKTSASMLDITLSASNLLTNMQAPSGVAADSEGNVYAASFSESKIYKITPDGAKSVYVWPVNLGGPIGIVMDGENNLYVANYTKNNIVKVTTSGVISEFAKVKKPYCLAIDPVKKILIVSEQDSNNILKYPL